MDIGGGGHLYDESGAPIVPAREGIVLRLGHDTAKKDIFAVLVVGVELSHPYHGEAVYIIKAKPCISPIPQGIVYHQADSR